ncbi:MAG: PepSY-like domain-containing protein [Phycisphaerae bacterium]|nr:PepSY-like domain-containing protein [Phycisphaerae bacterium]
MVGQYARSVWYTTVTCLLCAAGCSVELSKVTPEAKQSLATAFPEATITKVENELKWGGTVYEAELTQGAKKMEVKLSHDGGIIKVDTRMAMSDLPKAVAETITGATKGAKLTEIEKVEVLGKLGSGKVTKLAETKVYYKAKYRRLGLPAKIKVAPDGRRL